MENKYEVPANLFDKLQILLKKEAGVDDSFNSTDQSPPSSSSLDEAIAGFNPSADVLRCKNCGGELLRGSESIICVYCGRAQQQGGVPQPISFKSTSAFQWFLKSLDLNEFENVGKSLGVAQSGYGGRSLIKEEEISLSDFLDLQLNWPENSRVFGVRNEEQLPGSRYLSLIGVDIEEILAQDSRDHGSSVTNEQTVARQRIENDEIRVSGERSLSLFENLQSSEAVSRSGEGENDELFSDWGADFQSAFPDPGHEKSANISNLTTNNNHSSNLESGPHLNHGVDVGNILVEGGSKAIESVDDSFDWLPADQRNTTEDDYPSNENRDGDDSLDDWGDFRAVPGTNSSGGLVTSDLFDDFTGFVVSKDIQLPNNSFKVPDDAWNNFPTSTGGDIRSQIVSDIPEQHVGTGDSKFSGENDLALLDGTYLKHQGFNVESTQNKIIGHGDSTGLWSNDMHLGVRGELDQLQGRESKSPSSGTTNEVDNSYDLWNDFKGSFENQPATSREVPDDKISTEDRSSFDAWNDFPGIGVGKKEEKVSSLEMEDGKGNVNNSGSLTFWNDNSLDAWSDFAGSSGFSDTKPLSNGNSSGTWNDFESIMATHANQPQSSNAKTSDDRTVLEDDNLFSSWSDFRSSGTQSRNSSLGPNDTKTASDQISFPKVSNSLEKVEDYSSWDDFAGTTSNIEKQLKAAGAGSSENILNSGDGDLFSGFSNSGKQFTSQRINQLQSDGVTILDDNSTCENDDSFDAWSDFTSSFNVQEDLSSSANALDDKEAVKYGDLFDAWNVSASSPNVQAANETAVGMGKGSEINLFSPNINSQFVGSNSSVTLDSNVGMFSHQNGSESVASSTLEGPDLVRIKHSDVKADGNVDRANPSESALKDKLDLKSSVAETLISDMHDLSFMLESSLSITNSGR